VTDDLGGQAPEHLRVDHADRSAFPNSPGMWKQAPQGPSPERIAALKAEFPNSPGLWGGEAAPPAANPKADQKPGATKGSPARVPQGPSAERIAALQREYPASWQAMAEREGWRGEAAPPANAKPPGDANDPGKPDAATPVNAEVQAWAERTGADPAVIPAFSKAIAERQQEIADWRKTVLADPEIGTAESLRAVRALVKEYADEGFIEIMNSTGLGNHPSLVRLLSRVARELDRWRI